MLIAIQLSTLKPSRARHVTFQAVAPSQKKDSPRSNQSLPAADLVGTFTSQIEPLSERHTAWPIISFHPVVNPRHFAAPQWKMALAETRDPARALPPCSQTVKGPVSDLAGGYVPTQETALDGIMS